MRKSNTNDGFIDVVVKQWFTVRVSQLNVHCTVEDAALEKKSTVLINNNTVGWYIHIEEHSHHISGPVFCLRSTLEVKKTAYSIFIMEESSVELED